MRPAHGRTKGKNSELRPCEDPGRPGLTAISSLDGGRRELAALSGANTSPTCLLSIRRLYAPLLAQIIWFIGAIGMVAFAWIIVSRWMSHRQLVAHATPAWIVPVVGMLDLPLALPSLGLPPMHEVMVLGLAVGFGERSSALSDDLCAAV